MQRVMALYHHPLMLLAECLSTLFLDRYYSKDLPDCVSSLCSLFADDCLLNRPICSADDSPFYRKICSELKSELTNR